MPYSNEQFLKIRNCHPAPSLEIGDAHCYETPRVRCECHGIRTSSQYYLIRWTNIAITLIDSGEASLPGNA